MARRYLGFMASLAAVAFPATALAGESFEELARGATSIENLEQVVSPFLQVCGRGSSLQEFQCRAIRRRMQRRVLRRTYRYVASAVKVSPYDGRHLSYWVEPLACLTCNKPLKLTWGLYGGKDTWFVTGRVPKGIQEAKGGVVLAGLELKRHLRAGQKTLGIPVGPSDTEAWEAHVKPNLKVEFVFRPTGRTWVKGKHRGILVEILGYRLFEGCRGKVFASVPPSRGKGPLLASASCPVERTATARARRGPRLPLILRSDAIRQVMQKAAPAIRECYETYQIPGLAQVRITVRGADGTVAKAELRGKFRGTPTGKCILDTVQNLIFPRFRKKTMRFVYPFYLH